MFNKYLKLFFLTFLICLPLSLRAEVDASNKKEKVALSLKELVANVIDKFPLIIAQNREEDIAYARQIARAGAFDLKIKNKTTVRPYGYYETQQTDAVLEQGISDFGVDLYAGYRLGDGNFAIYEGKNVTSDGGEFRAGLNLPVFQDRSIDERRGGVQKADLGFIDAKQSIKQKQVFTVLKASIAYWNWVAAGKIVDISKKLYDTAKERDKGITERVDAGQLPVFESKDNQRNVLGREIKLIQANRNFQNAAISLSLYYRDSKGRPVLPVYQILPKEIEPYAWNDSLVEDDLYARAKKNRPEIRRIDLKLQKLAIDLKLAKNSYNPVLDLNAEISQDAGSVDTTRDQTEVSVGLVFEVPLQRRKAKGKITELEAKILQLKNKKVFLEESIFAEVKDAISELKNTEDQIKIVKREMELAKILEEGERIRFRNGKSTILVVNLREQATADTAVRKIKALARYNKAEAKLLATLGEI